MLTLLFMGANILIYDLGLFKITSAAMTPGTHPQRVNKKTIIIDPQPLSNTAIGGNRIESKTRQILIKKRVKLSYKDKTKLLKERYKSNRGFIHL
jgi:hypothetical protein